MDRVIYNALTSLMASSSKRDENKNQIKIEKAFQKSEYDIKNAFKVNEKDIQDLSTLILKVKNSISHSREKVKLMRTELESCKRLLFLHKEEVSQAWEKKLENEHLLSMVYDIRSIITATEKISTLSQHGNLVTASEMAMEITLKLENDQKLKSILAEFVDRFNSNKVKLSTQ
ncbi:MAG: Exocyst complex component 4, partial [Paramarteilia canceri]